MEPEELSPKKTEDPLGRLCQQDLDPLSVEDLQHRIAALEQEIVRTRAKMQAAVNHRASADALFKR